MGTNLLSCNLACSGPVLKMLRAHSLLNQTPSPDHSADILLRAVLAQDPAIQEMLRATDKAAAEVRAKFAPKPTEPDEIP